MKKIITILIIAVIVLGGYFLLKSQKSAMPNIQEEQETITTDELPSMETSQSTVTYTDNGYAPKELNVKIGETITFQNDSSQSMWPASALHPSHKEYSTTGGCLGSTFDACKGILPGDSWSFKFDIAGNWKYHDHLSPSKFGAVIVE